MHEDHLLVWLSSLFYDRLEAVQPSPARNVPGVTVYTTNVGDDGVAVTAGLSAMDTGLIADDTKREVRCEVVCCAHGSPVVVARLVEACCRALRDHAPQLIQPGLIVGKLECDDTALTDVTATYGVLVAPWLWDRGVPRYEEPAGGVAATGTSDTVTDGLGRTTLLVQLVMLTQEECGYAQAYGLSALQQELIRADIDVADLYR